MSSQVDNGKIFKIAWARTKDRWINFAIVIVQFIFLPIIIAAIISIGSIVALPYIFGASKDSGFDSVVQFVMAIAAITLPVVSIVGAVYRNIVGSIALTKIVIDSERNRKQTVAESKKLVIPYLSFLTVLTLINIGYFIYIPMSLFTIVFFIQVWTQFAMFSFVLDNNRGAINVWKGVQVYRVNFWSITLHAIILQLIATVIANLGNAFAYVTDGKKSLNMILIVTAIQIAIVLCSLLFQIFGIAYMYELYTRAKKPEKITVPKIFVIFSIIGWLIGLGAIAWGIQYIFMHPPQLPIQAPTINLDSAS